MEETQGRPERYLVWGGGGLKNLGPLPFGGPSKSLTESKTLSGKRWGGGRFVSENKTSQNIF
jgi:hypothetical protein